MKQSAKGAVGDSNYTVNEGRVLGAPVDCVGTTLGTSLGMSLGTSLGTSLRETLGTNFGTSLGGSLTSYASAEGRIDPTRDKRRRKL
jgi:hypothetical protein